jgi:hypothetical protein
LRSSKQHPIMKLRSGTITIKNNLTPKQHKVVKFLNMQTMLLRYAPTCIEKIPVLLTMYINKHHKVCLDMIKNQQRIHHIHGQTSKTYSLDMLWDELNTTISLLFS